VPNAKISAGKYVARNASHEIAGPSRVGVFSSLFS
jgi:hypothetical protein